MKGVFEWSRLLSPSVTEDHNVKEPMHTKSLMAQIPPPMARCASEESRMPAQVSSSSFHSGSKFRGRSLLPQRIGKQPNLQGTEITDVSN
ncbi:hypothetical protein TNCV_4821061 [Trichonephila clavipes]|nr:hypothetical protein TNCV_4821061 [Trichonephila clavipes]